MGRHLLPRMTLRRRPQRLWNSAARVVSPPVDAPYSRQTVIRDPQGATFAASQFVLENKDIGRSAAS